MLLVTGLYKSEITIMEELTETNFRESPGSSLYYRVIVGGFDRCPAHPGSSLYYRVIVGVFDRCPAHPPTCQTAYINAWKT